ncbi:hypothetical protein [Gordonia sp. OPL2]|uniref:hypothetical protein n=1 Tax=Gordonia sp. OPL2 TaxID=2486274 RepID=UPI0016561123|nr:hypothetical protein [Gordonia sp. OPL2]RPA06219.1 hypothetical protein EEB19_10185 [Gordonia sp. OPL2]
MSMNAGRDFRFIWTKRTDWVYQQSRASGIGLLVIAVWCGVVSVALSMPAMVIFSVGVALLPIVVRAPVRTKLVIRRDSVAVHRQPFYAHAGITLSAVIGIMFGGSLAAVFLGYGDAGRMLVPSLMGAAVIPVLLFFTYRERGPLLVGPESIRFGDGMTFDFDSTTIRFMVTSNAVPAIELTSPGVSRRPRRLLHRPYGLDFNTLLSTLEQLQIWHVDGRRATPAEIQAVSQPTQLEPHAHAAEIQALDDGYRGAKRWILLALRGEQRPFSRNRRLKFV